MPEPTERFSNRAESYSKYRPSYPAEVLRHLSTHCGLRPEAVIADVGSGTGKLSEPFLLNGNRVFGLEPNRAMREAGEALLDKYPRFISLNASAEATSLPEASIDLITAGQAFHWFDRERAKREFGRILKPGGWVALLWNSWDEDASALARAYAQVVERCGEAYARVSRKNVGEEEIAAFFAPNGFGYASFANPQHMGLEGLIGRAASSSYMPTEDHPHYGMMVADLTTLFETYRQGDRLVFPYRTQLYYGHL